MNNDYARIEKAIGFLQSHVTEQPDLETLARQVHLSPAHCQRLFKRWAGVSPKRFLQVLTVGHAKRFLADTSLLETAQASGLSSPSRLHEHFIAVEGVTPGQFKNRGEGLRIHWGAGETRFGRAWLAYTERGVCSLEFFETEATDDYRRRLQKAWPAAALERDDDGVRSMLERIFGRSGDPVDAPPVVLQGSNFQIQVWRALLRIPPGRACSYGQLAGALGRPTAARAVARAVGGNPVAWLIPCHRVLRASGALGGYRWGTARKQAMLAWEAVNHGEHGGHGDKKS